eukprot:Colp12_sorted_trinity150504_noHs@21624
MSQPRKKVKLSIEPFDETQVRSFSKDGTEYYEERSSLLESFFLLFNNGRLSGSPAETSAGSKDQPLTTHTNEEQESLVKVESGPCWPWQSISDKILTAQSEVDIMLDLLSLAISRKYLHTTSVTVLNEKQKVASIKELLASRKESMEFSHQLVQEQRQKYSEAMFRESFFYQALCEARGFWKLRSMAGHGIVADISCDKGERWNADIVCKENISDNTETLDAVVPLQLTTAKSVQVLFDTERVVPTWPSACSRTEQLTVHLRLARAQQALRDRLLWNQVRSEAQRLGTSVVTESNIPSPLAVRLVEPGPTNKTQQDETDWVGAALKVAMAQLLHSSSSKQPAADRNVYGMAVSAAQHVQVRQRVARVLRQLARAELGPCVLHAHWEAGGLATMSRAVVELTPSSAAHGPMHLPRRVFMLTVRSGEVHVASPYCMASKLQVADVGPLLLWHAAALVADLFRHYATLHGWLAVSAPNTHQGLWPVTQSFTANNRRTSLEMSVTVRDQALVLNLNIVEEPGCYTQQTRKLRPVDWSSLHGLNFQERITWLFEAHTRTVLNLP